MPNNKWDDDHIENLLKDFPAIKDARPKEEIYKRLKADYKPNKKPRRWVPLLVAALAFITFGVLLASMLGQNGNDSAFDMSGSEGSEESGENHSATTDNNAGSEAESAETESSEATEESGEGSDDFTAMQNAGEGAKQSVYADDLDGQTLFTLGLTENAVVIPVSFLISDDKLQTDFGTTEVNAADLYNRYADRVDEQDFGFDDYHPYSGSIETENEGIRHTLPEGHGYDMASASITVYMNSLAASFPDAARIAIVDEAGSPAEFSQVGPVQSFDPAPQNLAYYSRETANGEIFLVPGYDMPHDNVIDAFEAMKLSPNDLFSSVIPEELDFAVSETDNEVTVEFETAVDIEAMDAQTAQRMIEAMTLSADSFGKKVVLANIAADTWNGFDFTQALPVPSGINLKEIE